MLAVRWGVHEEAENAAERALARRLAAGDLAALGEAYDAVHTHVRAFARRLVGDDDAAEDLVQETFLALPGAAKGYRGDAPFRSFVIGVAANHARHHLRAAARRRAAMEKASQQALAGAVSTPSPASTRDLARALQGALDELPEEQRVAVVLCEVEGWTSGEVATTTGAPEATVRTRIFHAKKKLREALARRGVR